MLSEILKLIFRVQHASEGGKVCVFRQGSRNGSKALNVFLFLVSNAYSENRNLSLCVFIRRIKKKSSILQKTSNKILKQQFPFIFSLAA